ncbi:ricin-type beta-trefoil lectin domain protein [Streptomyces sp. NPDC059582]|uniref:RICIN domain-containing protein n=1 Tax=Streptomyces sp. NPDC059582 TaxID=3346875 RepID=UPI00368997EE
MQSPNPPRPPYPPRPGAAPGESDRDLVAQLGTPEAGDRAVALLLVRHWRATYDYAGVCLAASDGSAQLVATAAVHRVLARLTAGQVGGALRPQLLVAVRDTVREWAGQDGISAVLPELRKTTGGRGLRVARPVTPERRQLAERAFQALPGASQCLLWHTEVEAEPLSVPAGLSGVDRATAATALQHAREQFRTGCVRAHRELAPTRECRFHNRLLDVSMRRGGTLLPDVRRHLTQCRYCRHAAEQLSHFDGGLDVLLAETVLGWGARRYLDSRPGRGAAPWESGFLRVPGRPGGRHRHASGSRLDPPRRPSRAVLVGAGLTSLALLATVLVTKGWSDDRGVPGPDTTWGAPGVGIVRPGPEGQPSSDGTPPTASASSAGYAETVAHGRLRSPAAGLCLDAHAGLAEAGAPAGLAVCSAAGSQQWAYQGDGLLRSAADPARCLGADPDRHTVTLVGCVAQAGEVTSTYDLTIHGELLLRRGEGLVVAPGSGAARDDVVVAARDGSDAQRWLFDPGTGQAPERDPRDTRTGGPRATRPGPTAPGSGAPHGTPGAPPRSLKPEPEPEPRYDKQFVRVGCCDEGEPAAKASPVVGLGSLAGDLSRAVSATVVTAAGPGTVLARLGGRGGPDRQDSPSLPGTVLAPRTG